MVEKLLRQRRVDEIVLRNNEEPRSALVEPVDDPRPGLLAGRRKLIAAMMEERMNERSGIIGVGGMGYHPRGLVHHEQGVVFEEDVKRDVFGQKIRRGRCRDSDGNDLAR